jgi:hypothetical protein
MVFLLPGSPFAERTLEATNAKRRIKAFFFPFLQRKPRELEYSGFSADFAEVVPRERYSKGFIEGM